MKYSFFIICHNVFDNMAHGINFGNLVIYDENSCFVLFLNYELGLKKHFDLYTFFKQNFYELKYGSMFPKRNNFIFIGIIRFSH